MVPGEPPLELAGRANGEGGNGDGLGKPLEEVLVVGVPADALVGTFVKIDEAGVEMVQLGEDPRDHFPEKWVGVCGRVGLVSPIAVSAGARLSDKPEAASAPQVGPVRNGEEEVPQTAEGLPGDGFREVSQRAAGREEGRIEQLLGLLAATAQTGPPPGE